MQDIGAFGVSAAFLVAIGLIAIGREMRPIPHRENWNHEGVISRVGILGMVGLFFLVAVATQPAFDKDPKWIWHWRDPPRFPIYVYCFIVLPPLLWLVEGIADGGRRHKAACLTALCVVCFLFQLLALYGEENSFGKIARIVKSADATSYFTDSLVIQNVVEWLGNFHTVEKNLHSNTHPPGPILFYYVLRNIFGQDLAAYVGGILTGLLASSGVVFAYHFAQFWGASTRASLLAATNYAVLPALIVFFPSFDQVYPVAAMAMIILWASAIQKGNLVYSVSFGLLLSVIIFFVYNLLVVGAFLSMYSLYEIHQSSDRWRAIRICLRQMIIAVGIVIFIYSVLYFITNYNPISAFIYSVEWQSSYEQRPYGPALIINVFDFALGSGVLLVILFIFYLSRGRVPLMDNVDTFRLSIMAGATIVIVNFTGLLNYETARVWLFLQPFLIVPASIELARYPQQAIVGFFILQWVVVTTMKANMLFLGA